MQTIKLKKKIGTYFIALLLGVPGFSVMIEKPKEWFDPQYYTVGQLS